MKNLWQFSVEDYGTIPLKIMVVSTMKGYLRQMSEDEAMQKIEVVMEPKIIQLVSEDGV